MASDIRLEVVRCYEHGFYAVTIRDGNGGVRLTPGKCCGSWNETVVSWKLDAEQAARLAEDVAGFVDLASARPHPEGGDRQ